MSSDDTTVVQRIGLQGLTCLVALVTEASVTKAAASLDMGQPAMSNVLAKLRQLLQDPVLVRTSHGMEPTPYAVTLAGAVRLHLRELEAAFEPRSDFDSGTAENHIRIATADSNVQTLRPFLKAMRASAPGMQVSIRQPDFGNIRAWLEESQCDLAIGYFPGLAEGLRQTTLYCEHYRVLAAANHAIIGSDLSLDQYASAVHVGSESRFHSLPTGEEALKRALAALGLSKRVGIKLESSLLYGEVVASTDMIATLGERLASYFASLHDIKLFALPFEAPPLTVSMVWHERTHQHAAHRWVRRLLVKTISHEPALP